MIPPDDFPAEDCAVFSRGTLFTKKNRPSIVDDPFLKTPRCPHLSYIQELSLFGITLEHLTLEKR